MAMDLTCPTTGERCSYREHVSRIYTSANLGPTRAIEGFSVELDEMKLHIKMAEHSVAAVISGCRGMVNDEGCPTAEKMSASPTRRTVKGVLSIIRR